jgi:hypothetical protein
MAQQHLVALAYEEARQAPTTENKSRVSESTETRRALAMDSYTRLLQALSPEGATKLQTQIAQMKSQMKAIAPALP